MPMSQTMSVAGACVLAQAANFVAAETGANNAIVVTLNTPLNNPVPLAAGLRILVKLGHTLQIGANTIVFNGSAAKSIKSALNPANNIATAYVVGSMLDLVYDGTQWQDLGQ